MSDYIIYTTDNGVLNFKNNLRVFLGRSVMLLQRIGIKYIQM